MKRTVWLLSMAAFAQDPATTIERASDKLLAESARLPKYVCVETIDRSYYSRSVAPLSPLSCEQLVLDRKNGNVRLKLDKTDRLRVAVTVEERREIYSWTGVAPPAHRVEDILDRGPLSTGAYATHLLDIFTNPAVHFQLQSENAAAIEYGFRAPVKTSRMLASGGGDWIPTGYGGSLRIDRDNLDIERLVVETDELPAATSLCQHSTVLEFRSRQTAGAGWFVPSASHSHDILRDASETESAVTIADCRAGAAAAPPAPSYQAPPLEPGVPLRLSLDSDIDTDVAAAGDPVSATVTSIGRLPFMPPQGARVTGRIVAMIHRLDKRPAFLIALAFDTLERKGVTAPFYAKLVRLLPWQEGLGKLHGVPDRAVILDLGAWPQGGFWFAVDREEKRCVIPAGFPSLWETIAPVAAR